MKKILLILTVLVFSSSVAIAQSRSVGIGFGYGKHLSYQHSLTDMSFVQVDMAVPYNGIGITGTLNRVNPLGIECPIYTDYGDWDWYLGLGSNVGFSRDRNNVNHDGIKVSSKERTFHYGIVSAIGLEYNLDIPLTISFGWNPTFGPYTSTNITKINGEKDKQKDSGFYTDGLASFTIALRFRL